MKASVTKIDNKGAVGLSEQQFIDVLKNSLYPGAKDDSVRLVLLYCEAAKLDVMQKPVHIVSMLVPTGRKNNSGYDIKEHRDVIMPGIGLYRIQASRTNQYAGISEPEYGEEVTATMDGVEVTFPKWCKITVDKIMDGAIRPFSAKEFWLENYATKSSSSLAPNSMWYRRPYAQLAKCAEAQALRKAFPDSVGSGPTAEEMEGKEFGEVIDHTTGEILSGKPHVSLPQSKSEQSQAAPEARDAGPQTYDAEPQKDTKAPESAPEAPKAGNGGPPVSQGEKNFLLAKAKQFGMTIEAALADCNLTGDLSTLTKDGFTAMKDYFMEKGRG